MASDAVTDQPPEPAADPGPGAAGSDDSPSARIYRYIMRSEPDQRVVEPAPGRDH